MTELVEVGPDDWRTWLEIRLRALADAPSAFGSTYAETSRMTEEQVRTRLDHQRVDGLDVLALASGRPVGMAGGWCDRPGWLHVVGMWVDPTHRGHGLAAVLLDHVVAWARRRGLRAHLDVTVGNDAARRAYERYGFVGTGETGPLRPGRPETLARMVLGPAAATAPQAGPADMSGH